MPAVRQIVEIAVGIMVEPNCKAIVIERIIYLDTKIPLATILTSMIVLRLNNA